MDWEIEKIVKPGTKEITWYKEHEADAVVVVLGQEYKIYMNVPDEEDATLEKCSGYCDKTDHRIVIGKIDGCNLGEPMAYVKYVLRHEIIHAFLFESGIGGDTTWQVDGEEHPEHMVEWIGMQFPKMLKAFQEVGAL